MRRTRALAIATSVALALPAFAVGSLASAQEARKAAMADTATITAIDPEGRSITVGDGGDEKRFRIDDRTRISIGSEHAQLSSLEVGDRIAVTASAEGAEPGGPPIADEIAVVIDQPDVAAGEASVPSESGSPSASGASDAGAAGSDSGVGERTVSLRDAQGQDVGEARIVDSPNGILIHVAFHSLPPGSRGFHIHETGRCEPSFDAAGDHFAGGGTKHGFLNEGAPHAGDLVNLEVASDGRVEAVVRAPALRIADLEDEDGSALVIHADADDYRSQPAGAAGDRIACGVIGSGGGSRHSADR